MILRATILLPGRVLCTFVWLISSTAWASSPPPVEHHLLWTDILCLDRCAVPLSEEMHSLSEVICSQSSRRLSFASSCRSCDSDLFSDSDSPGSRLNGH